MKIKSLNFNLKGEKLFDQIWKIYLRKIDKYIFYIKTRWTLSFLGLCFYIYRISILGGFHVISYIMGLYILHLGVQFFQPLGLPSIDDDIIDNEVYEDLPISGQTPSNNDDFKPLIRSVSEFKFWQNVSFCVGIAIVCTYFKMLDLPVFWPFLLVYFIVLLLLTVRKMLLHMNHFNYGFFHNSGKHKGETTGMAAGK